MLTPHLGCDRFPGGEIFKLKVTFKPGCDYPIANIEVVCMITWTFTYPPQRTSDAFRTQSGNNRWNPEILKGTKIPRHTRQGKPSIPNQSTTNHNATSTTYVWTPLLYSTFSTYIQYTLGSPSRWQTPCSLQVPIHKSAYLDLRSSLTRRRPTKLPCSEWRMHEVRQILTCSMARNSQS